MSTQVIEPTTTGQRDDRMPLVVTLLVVVIVLQLVGLIWLNAKVNAVQDQATAAAEAAMSAGQAATSGGQVVTTDLSTLDACRVLGALALKAGVPVATLFRDEQIVGGCESAAEQGAQMAKSAG